MQVDKRPAQTTPLHRGAVDVAAKATGLRDDQIDRAVNEYRAALDDIEGEPSWQAGHNAHEWAA